MEITTQPKLAFLGVDILNINFNSIAPYSNNIKVKFNCSPMVFYPKDNNKSFKIIMDISMGEDKYFSLSIKAIGNFEFDIEITEAIRKQFVNINAPAIMFPFIRAFISVLTANLGMATQNIIIPTKFFSGELKELNPDS